MGACCSSPKNASEWQYDRFAPGGSEATPEQKKDWVYFKKGDIINFGLYENTEEIVSGRASIPTGDSVMYLISYLTMCVTRDDFSTENVLPVHWRESITHSGIVVRGGYLEDAVIMHDTLQITREPLIKALGVHPRFIFVNRAKKTEMSSLENVIFDAVVNKHITNTSKGYGSKYNFDQLFNIGKAIHSSESNRKDDVVNCLIKGKTKGFMNDIVEGAIELFYRRNHTLYICSQLVSQVLHDCYVALNCIDRNLAKKSCFKVMFAPNTVFKDLAKVVRHKVTRDVKIRVQDRKINNTNDPLLVAPITHITFSKDQLEAWQKEFLPNQTCDIVVIEDGDYNKDACLRESTDDWLLFIRSKLLEYLLAKDASDDDIVAHKKKTFDQLTEELSEFDHTPEDFLSQSESDPAVCGALVQNIQIKIDETLKAKNPDYKPPQPPTMSQFKSFFNSIFSFGNVVDKFFGDATDKVIKYLKNNDLSFLATLSRADLPDTRYLSSQYVNEFGFVLPVDLALNTKTHHVVVAPIWYGDKVSAIIKATTAKSSKPLKPALLRATAPSASDQALARSIASVSATMSQVKMTARRNEICVFEILDDSTQDKEDDKEDDEAVQLIPEAELETVLSDGVDNQIEGESLKSEDVVENQVENEVEETSLKTEDNVIDNNGEQTSLKDKHREESDREDCEIIDQVLVVQSESEGETEVDPEAEAKHN